MRSTPLALILALAAGLQAAELQTAQAQQPVRNDNAPAAVDSFRFDVGAGIDIVEANASPGVCGCFFMTGGTVHIGYAEGHGLASLFDYGITQAQNINGNNYNLTLSTYLFGERYQHSVGHHISPFVQALAGLAHSKTNEILDNSKTGFAGQIGGGLDIKLSDSFDYRLVDAAYLPNRIPNGQNNWQNQARISTGIVYHFKQR